MSDLIESLRSVKEAGNVPRWLEGAALEAADTIEKLRVEVETFRHTLEEVVTGWNAKTEALQAENERLRAALTEITKVNDLLLQEDTE